jgi:riboflavin synthase
MFTGLVEAACPLIEASPAEGGRRLAIDLSLLRQESPGEQQLVVLGESVAVNGVCLTVASQEGDQASFDVVPETLSRTTLGDAQVGQRVNVERAMCLGDRLGGHLVQGHVETTGLLSAREELPGELRLTVTCGTSFVESCLPKGSVTVDGVSLTLAELRGESFVVALVPHTLERTTLDSLALGERVNLEPDMIGQWVLRAMGRRTGP